MTSCVWVNFAESNRTKSLSICKMPQKLLLSWKWKSLHLSADKAIGNGNVFFFEGKGSRQLELLLVEAANGVTPAIQGLNIFSGVITPRILGRGIYPGILGGGGIYPQDSRGGIYPQDSREGVNNPNNPPYVRHC